MTSTYPYPQDPHRRDPYHDPAYAADPYGADPYGADPYGAEPYGPPPGGERSSVRAVLWTSLWAMASLATLAGVLVWAYGAGASDSAQLSALHSDRPWRTAPDEPGGYVYPGQDRAVYERIGAAEPALAESLRRGPDPEAPTMSDIDAARSLALQGATGGPPPDERAVIDSVERAMQDGDAGRRQRVIDIDVVEPRSGVELANRRPDFPPNVGTGSTPPPDEAVAYRGGVVGPDGVERLETVEPAELSLSMSAGASPFFTPEAEPQTGGAANVAPPPAGPAVAGPNDAPPPADGSAVASETAPPAQVEAATASAAAGSGVSLSGVDPAAGAAPLQNASQNAPQDAPPDAPVEAPVEAAAAAVSDDRPTAANEEALISITGAEPPAPASASAGAPLNWRVQLGALDSVRLAETRWEELKSAHPDLLGQFELEIDGLDVDGDRLYRIRVGRFANRRQASQLCDRLKARGVDCWAASQ